jgi:putative transposon-encoded protein
MDSEVTSTVINIFILCCDNNLTMTKEMDITSVCYGMVDRVVGPAGHSGRVHVPKAWVGKRVRVLLLDPIDEE